MITISALEWMDREPGDWGPWRLNVDALTLVDVGKGSWRYEVDLERCQTPAELLDWIFQVNTKIWSEKDDGVLAGLIRAVDDVIKPQATLCSGGAPSRIVTKDLHKMVAAAALRWPQRCWEAP